MDFNNANTIKLKNWKEEVKLKLQSCAKSYYNQRIQLELAIETTHRDSRYSDGLIDLMKKEENAIQENVNSPVSKELIARVDEALRSETQKFFSKNTQQNSKKWVALAQKLEREQISAQEEIDRLMSQHRNVSQSGSASSSINGSLQAIVASTRPLTSSVSSGGAPVVIENVSELDVELKRLEEDYNKNWYLYESFHLKEAFQSQLSRVDVEWGVHETALKQDYEARRAQVLGTTANQFENGNGGSDASATSRWQHPEKQKTLVHTAPVLSPTKNNNSLVNRIFKGSNNANITAELTKLEKRYITANDSLQSQKAGARRWIARQQIRLLTQAKEVQEERQLIGGVIANERMLYEVVFQRQQQPTI